MARKKRKAEKSAPKPSPNLNRPAAEFRGRGRGKGKENEFAPFPPPACAAPVWPHFWTLLAAGFALRLLAGLSSDWAYRADEVMQYLEQAHRLLFGAGFMPWEIRIGARNLLIAAPAAGVMAICKSAGAGPDCYIPAVKMVYAALSLAIPAALYLVARRLWDEAAGRAALVFGCLWYEFVVFAPHVMPEQSAVIFILAGMACLPPRESVSAGVRLSAGAAARLFLAGLCVGLGGLLRLPYIPAAGILGILILLGIPARRAPLVLGGAAAALGAAGTVDWIVWGKFLNSAFAYLEAWAVTDRFQAAGTTPWHIQFERLAACSAGLWPLLFVLAAANWRRHWVPLAVAAAVLAVHAYANTHSYSHVFLAPAMLALAFGGIASRPPEFLRGILRGGRKTAAAGALALLSLAGATHSLPGMSAAFWPEVRQPRFFFHEFPLLRASRFLSRVPPEKMRAVLWTAPDPYNTGGYYYFHHRVPQLFTGLAGHRPLLEGKAPGEVASHMVALSREAAARALAAGFVEAANFGGAIVYENPQWEKVSPPEPFPLILAGGTGDMLEAAEKMPPPVFLRARE